MTALSLATVFLFAGCSSPRHGSIPNRSPQAQSPKDSTPAYGVASYYGQKYHGRRTASGEVYDMNKMTAAHRTLPFGLKVRVTELASNRSVVVRINDRGPFIRGRIIDLSRAAAQRLGIIQSGSANVKLEIFPDSPPRAGLNLSTK